MQLPPARTARFEAFVAPARARAALWRLLLGIALVASVWMAVSAGLLLVLARIPVAPAAEERALLVAALASFAGLILGLGLALRLLHGRGLASVIGDRARLGRDFGAGVAVVAGLTVVGAALILATAPPARQLPLGVWLGWLPFALAAVLIQTAAEEMVFRGYLQQQLAARFASPWVWWFVPALTFGLLHWNPAAFGPNAWAMVLAAGLIGLIAGDATARTGSLGLALGLHFANNAVALLLIAVPSPLAALSLYLAPIDPGDAEAVRRALLIDIATVLCAYALWIALRRGRR